MPPVGRSKRPGFSAVGAGEGAALVPEQLGLEQGFRQRRAVDGEEGPVGALAGVMDGARDQLLAGAALAGDQDSRLGRRDLGRRVQRLSEGGRAPHDLVEAEALAELLPERVQAPPESLRPPLGCGRALLLLGQPLMLDRERHVGRDHPGDLHVGRVVPVRSLLLEEERPSHPFAEPERADQGGSRPIRDDPAVAGPLGIELTRGIADQRGFARPERVGERVVVRGHARSDVRVGPVGHAAEILDAAPAGVDQRRSHGVEIQDRANGIGQPVEDVLDVQAGAQHRHQAHEAFQAAASALLSPEGDDVLDEGADQVGDPSRGIEVIPRERARRRAADEERSDGPGAARERHGDERPDPHPQEPGPCRRQLGQTGVSLHVVRRESVAGENGCEAPLIMHVASARVEARRVPTVMQGGALTPVLGEHGARASLVFQVGDHHAVVRDQRLEVAGKRLQETVRIERILDRMPDGGQHGEKIGGIGDIVLTHEIQSTPATKRERDSASSCARGISAHAGGGGVAVDD